MSIESISCPKCGTGIHIERIFIQVVKQNVASDILYDKKNLQMDCPNCNNDIDLSADEIITNLSISENFLSGLAAIADAKPEDNSNPDLEKILQRQRDSLDEAIQAKQESQNKKESIENGLQEIRDNLANTD